MDAYVKTKKVEQGITEIEFFHPAHNSLPSYILKQLADTISACGQNPEVSIIILKSGGDRTFCAGASFDELITIDEFEVGKHFFMGFANVINACRKCPKLIIGRVQGKAVGGGVGLASAVDYCIASDYASVKLSELNVGIGPFVVGPAVERKIGVSAFSQMSINAGEFYSAIWAMNQGLYAKVVDDVDELDNEVLSFAQKLNKTNPEARTKLKSVFWEGCEHWDELLEKRAEESGRLVLSEFAKKALDKYK